MLSLVFSFLAQWFPPTPPLPSLNSFYSPHHPFAFLSIFLTHFSVVLPSLPSSLPSSCYVLWLCMASVSRGKRHFAQWPACKHPSHLLKPSIDFSWSFAAAAVCSWYSTLGKDMDALRSCQRGQFGDLFLLTKISILYLLHCFHVSHLTCQWDRWDTNITNKSINKDTALIWGYHIRAVKFQITDKTLFAAT